MTIYDTKKQWAIDFGQGGLYEKTFDYAFRNLKFALRMLFKLWYIECIISVKRGVK